MSERRKAMRRRKVCAYVREVQAVNRDRDRVIVLTRELARGLGGRENIVTLFRKVFEEAKAANRSFTAFRVLKTVLDLSIVAEDLSRERVREMSDKDLEAELLRGSILAVQENPQMAILAAHQQPIEFTFVNKYGERWLLRVDPQTETGELTGDELGDSTVQIADDLVQSDLILGADESVWLAECWKATTGRPLRVSPFQRFVSLMSAISKGSHDQD